MSLAGLVGTFSLACGIAAIVLYVALLARRPRLPRLFNGLGLFLTGLAMFQAPAILRATGGDLNAIAAVLLLDLALIAQAYAGLRHRGGWDGVERRMGEGKTA